MSAATVQPTGVGGGGFFNPKRRRLSYSVGIAIVIEVVLAFWAGSITMHNIKKESSPPQKPIVVQIVKPQVQPKPKPKPPPPKVIPKIATPIPTHQIMPNIKPPPVMPQLSQQATGQVLPTISQPLPPPPSNSVYAKQEFLNSIHSAIEAQLKYPPEALLAGHTGNVVVGFIYLDGHASNIHIVKHAQDDSLNQEAIKMVMQAHLPPPPPNLVGQPLKLEELIVFVIH